jgi:hypothetical protein
MVYHQYEGRLYISSFLGDCNSVRTLGSDPDSLPLGSSSLDSFPSLLLGTVSLTISTIHYISSKRDSLGQYRYG